MFRYGLMSFEVIRGDLGVVDNFNLYFCSKSTIFTCDKITKNHQKKNVLVWPEPPKIHPKKKNLKNRKKKSKTIIFFSLGTYRLILVELEPSEKSTV